ncbi:MAG: aldehyde dehydrogenase family protein [Nitrospinae bacterium]|nr:aldehyde dehydrogenase family protein [Nitrospinota bacterium]MBL7021025.1 aldehyde dehydrogenase family protein [Nitrospinaceae bacterium]
MTKRLKVNSPYDGHLISEIDLDDADRIESALKTAHQLAQNQDKILPAHRRIEILGKTAELVQAKAEEFARQSAEEGGKPLIDSRIELGRAVQGIREAAQSIGKLTGHEIPMNLTASSMNRMALTTREPIGVVAAISAFNHPFNLIVHQVIPAIAVGCPVIVKPARTTPLSCLNLVKCLYEAGLPEEWCQAIVCESSLAEKLVTDPRVAFFSFIGSGEVGWMLRSKLAPGTRCALEHGGAAPVIIDHDADMEDALPLLAKGGFYHAGQVCVSVQKVFVHESLVEDFSEKLVKLAEKLIVGDPTDEKTEVGPLIQEKEVDRVDQWVKQAKEAGAKILTGGKKIGATCYAPTVLLNPPDETKVSTHEIFGPVINIYPFKDRLKAIERANLTPFSFQAAVFTRNIDTALDTAKRINAAAVMINDHTAFRVDWMPFGGRKDSGLGVGGILPTMMEMTEEKLLVFRSKLI